LEAAGDRLTRLHLFRSIAKPGFVRPSTFSEASDLAARAMQLFRGAQRARKEAR
jgi:hypothetical protein